MEIIKNIQSNWGEHLGYVGFKPIATSSGEKGVFIRIATDERYYDPDDDDDQGYTEYDGFEVLESEYDANPEKWLKWLNYQP